MADIKQLAVLEQGVHVWNAWRSKNLHVKIDLSRANFQGANLDGANLGQSGDIWVNLSKADLSKSSFVGANLRRAKLGGADLSGANLSASNLVDAKLSEANLNEASLVDADLLGATLGRASAIKADFRGANLTKARLIGVNFSGANLQAAEFTRAVLVDAVFADTDLTDVTGLDWCEHYGPSAIDHRTLSRSPSLPDIFLRGCGLPEPMIEYLPSIMNRAIEFYSCFISYNHQDKHFARRLHDQLQGRGIRCWLDDHQVLPGDDIFNEIEQGIRLWDKILLCCSEASLKRSPWVNREIDKALQKEEFLWKERGYRGAGSHPAEFGQLPVPVGQWQSQRAEAPFGSGLCRMGERQSEVRRPVRKRREGFTFG